MKHWLMKTEPETFSIDDLARVKVEPWTGVRGHQARNLMRDEMQVGDPVLFYHSSADPSGVAGLARIVRTGVVDATQFDPASPYHDPTARQDDPRWICVDVEFVEKFGALVPLSELREVPSLRAMWLLRKGMRLSVQPVTPRQYEVIVELGRGARPTAAPKASAASRTRSRR